MRNATPWVSMPEIPQDPHAVVLLGCAVVCLVVFAVMFYAIWAHRQSHRGQSTPFHGSLVAELIWAAVPVLIVIGMVTPAAKVVLAQGSTVPSTGDGQQAKAIELDQAEGVARQPL